MNKNTIDKLYFEIEEIENTISDIDLKLLEFNPLRKRYDKWMAEAPLTKNNVKWFEEVYDFLNWMNKYTIVAKYNKMQLKRKLKNVKAQIDNLKQN